MCARFLSNLSFLYIGRVHGTISGCTVLGEVHPLSAQNKSLISDTGIIYFAEKYIFTFWNECLYNQKEN